MGIVKDISSKIRSAAATYNQGDQRSGLADWMQLFNARNKIIIRYDTNDSYRSNILL